jgi:ribosomal protein S18 acetylase RimI-like enzyme
MRRLASVALRPAIEADRSFVDALSARVFATYSIDPVATTRMLLSELGALVTIADLGRSRGGFSVLGLERARPMGPWRAPVIARLNAIAARPDAEGRGIGAALLGHAVETARAEGAVGLYLMTAESNARARALFERFGFLTLYGVDAFYARGQRAVAMMKPLAT